jgi:hypothetical protein
MAQWNGFSGTLSSVCEIWDRCGANGEFIALCVTLSDYLSQRFQNPYLLACHLPPGVAPGVVKVTLSKHSQPDAPEYGTSTAKFEYAGVRDQL